MFTNIIISYVFVDLAKIAMYTLNYTTQKITYAIVIVILYRGNMILLLFCARTKFNFEINWPSLRTGRVYDIILCLRPKTEYNNIR